MNPPFAQDPSCARIQAPGRTFLNRHAKPFCIPSLRTFLIGSASSKKGQPALDWWTLPHVASGIALALLLAEPWTILALLVLYEAFEAGLRRYKTRSGAGVFEYESWPNIVADVIVAMVPWLILWLFFPWYEAPIRFFG